VGRKRRLAGSTRARTAAMARRRVRIFADGEHASERRLALGRAADPPERLEPAGLGGDLVAPALGQDVPGPAARVVRDGARQFIAELLVEAARLETEGVEPGADAPARPGLSLCSGQQLGAEALPSQLLRHEQQFHEQPVVDRPAVEPAASVPSPSIPMHRACRDPGPARDKLKLASPSKIVWRCSAVGFSTVTSSGITDSCERLANEHVETERQQDQALLPGVCQAALSV
jgi:hypothetical protein